MPDVRRRDAVGIANGEEAEFRVEFPRRELARPIIGHGVRSIMFGVNLAENACRIRRVGFPVPGRRSSLPKRCRLHANVCSAGMSTALHETGSPAGLRADLVGSELYISVISVTAFDPAIGGCLGTVGKVGLP